MSSRVQKGNVVFRPVTKARGRPASATPMADPRSSGAPSASNHAITQLATPPASMPPPPVSISSRLVSTVPSQGSLVPIEEETSTVIQARPSESLPTPLPTESTVMPRAPSVAVAPPPISSLDRSTPISVSRSPPISTTSSENAPPVVSTATPVSRTRSTRTYLPPVHSEQIRGGTVPELPYLQPPQLSSSATLSRRPPGDPTSIYPVPLAEKPSEFPPQYLSQSSQESPALPGDISEQAPSQDPPLPYAPFTHLPTQGNPVHYDSAPLYPHLAFGQPDARISLYEAANTSPNVDNTPKASTPHKRAARKAKGKTMAENSGVEDGEAATPPRKRRARHPPLKSATAENTEQHIAAPDEAELAPSTRKRRTVATAASSGTDVSSPASSPAPKRRKRRTSTDGSHRVRKKRVATPPPWDGTAEGAELDPTATTMADLCEDVGTGRVSTKAAQIVANHTAWKAASREKRERLKTALEAKKYGREDEDGANKKQEGSGGELQSVEGAVSGGSNASNAPQTDPTAADEEDHGLEPEVEKDGFDYSKAVNTSRFNVQVRIGPNGETIIDEQSLFVDRANEEEETAEYTHIEESDATKFVNSMSYSKKARGSRWSAEETEFFFDALSQFGENYELISLIMPGRDRKACKNKFKAEDRKNPARITYCLNNRTPYDIKTLARLTGKDFSGPTPIIRAPTPPTLAETESTQSATKKSAADPPARVKRKKSRTPAVPSDGEEILGTADGFIDNDD